MFTYKCINFVSTFKALIMTEKDKFIKIMTKAESNGFKFRNDAEIDEIEYIGMGRFRADMTIEHEQEEGSVEEKVSFTFNITEVFFNHNFAKTFFGTQEVCGHCGEQLKVQDVLNGSCSNCEVRISEVDPMENWKHKLQKLVLEEDLLEYLVGHVG